MLSTNHLFVYSGLNREDYLHKTQVWQLLSGEKFISLPPLPLIERVILVFESTLNPHSPTRSLNKNL